MAMTPARESRDGQRVPATAGTHVEPRLAGAREALQDQAHGVEPRVRIEPEPMGGRRVEVGGVGDLACPIGLVPLRTHAGRPRRERIGRARAQRVGDDRARGHPPSVRYGGAHPTHRRDRDREAGSRAPPGGRPLSRDLARRCGRQGRRPSATAILYLLAAGERSTWHRVDATEVWLFHGGDPLELCIAAGDDAQPARHVLGTEVVEGDQPQLVVPAGAWQSARTLGGWTLVSCVVSPGFRFEGFELAPPAWEPGRTTAPPGALGRPASLRGGRGRGSARPSAADRASIDAGSSCCSSSRPAARPCARRHAVNASSARAAARSRRSMPAPGQIPTRAGPRARHRRRVAGTPHAHLGGTGPRGARVHHAHDEPGVAGHPRAHVPVVGRRDEVEQVAREPDQDPLGRHRGRTAARERQREMPIRPREGGASSSRTSDTSPIASSVGAVDVADAGLGQLDHGGSRLEQALDDRAEGVGGRSHAVGSPSARAPGAEEAGLDERRLETLERREVMTHDVGGPPGVDHRGTARRRSGGCDRR